MDPSSLRYAVASKDRMTVLPKSLREQIAEQIEKAREIWRKDREERLAGVYLPGALARKYRRAAESFEWFWLYPARQTSIDPETRSYTVARDSDERSMTGLLGSSDVCREGENRTCCGPVSGEGAGNDTRGRVCSCAVKPHNPAGWETRHNRNHERS